MHPKRHVALVSLSALAVSGAFVLGEASPAAAQPVAEIVAPPPPPIVATVEPVYYEGHASYWYGGHWYWRDGRGWHSYREEPAFLRERRLRTPPPRHHYEEHHRR